MRPERESIVVSIVIPALNEERVIGECLRALTRLDFPKESFEVILVDNGSTDRTVEIARTFSMVNSNQSSCKSPARGFPRCATVSVAGDRRGLGVPGRGLHRASALAEDGDEPRVSRRHRGARCASPHSGGLALGRARVVRERTEFEKKGSRRRVVGSPTNMIIARSTFERVAASMNRSRPARIAISANASARPA